MLRQAEDAWSPGTRLRLARQARGLSQQQLAGVAGVTRQAVSAVEAGHSDPSLRVALGLARALGMTIEELFGRGEPADPVRARLVAPAAGAGSRVALATVGDGFVALPLRGDTVAQAGFSPAGGLVTGPAGNPIADLDTIAVRPIGPPRPTLVVAGCDPALPLLQTPLALLDPAVGFAWWPCGSAEALRLAEAGLVHAAGVHSAGHELDADVVGFASWREGLVIRPGTPVKDLGDVARLGLRLVNREVGAQARTLLDEERQRLHLDPADLAGYDSQAAGHLQVAAAVAGRIADAGVSSEPAALAYGLDFLPLATERFDLVLPASLVASREVQGLLKVLTSPWLVAQLASLPGYDPASCGERIAARLNAVDRDEECPRDRMEAQVEPAYGRRCLRLESQARHVERVHGEHIAVRFISGRRRGTAEVPRAVVVAQVKSTGGQRAAWPAGAGRQRGHRGRHVNQHPVPEAGSGRRVGVEAGDGEALGLGRETGPGQRRRYVLPGHAERAIYLSIGHHLAVGDIVATQVERRQWRHEVIRQRRASGHGYLLVDVCHTRYRQPRPRSRL
jgi:putative molybdopterin biosynthesis protein